MQKLIVASECLANGELTRRELGRYYVKLHTNIYSRRDVELDARDLAVAAWLWSARRGTVAGLSAAALLGSRWVPDDGPAELLRTFRRSPPGIVVRSDTVGADEVSHVGDIACTAAARTAFDLGRWLPFEEGLIRVDALLNATGVSVDAVREVADRHPGSRNIRRLRQVLELADGGTESPQETRLRSVLIRGDLPKPETQIRVGRRRVDMGWEDWKVGVEYDGEQHWTDPLQHAGDIERLDYLARAGWTIVRVSAVHLRTDRAGIV